MARPRERLSVSMSADDRALIESAATAAGVSVAAWMVRAACEEARWAGAASVLGLTLPGV